MHDTCNIGAYELIVTLPGSRQVLCKSLQLLNQLPHLKVIAREDTIHAVVCFPPDQECLRGHY